MHAIRTGIVLRVEFHGTHYFRPCIYYIICYIYTYWESRYIALALSWRRFSWAMRPWRIMWSRSNPKTPSSPIPTNPLGLHWKTNLDRVFTVGSRWVVYFSRSPVYVQCAHVQRWKPKYECLPTYKHTRVLESKWIEGYIGFIRGWPLTSWKINVKLLLTNLQEESLFFFF